MMNLGRAGERFSHTMLARQCKRPLWHRFIPFLNPLNFSSRYGFVYASRI
ncbi:hypothetical protein [Nitrosomonas oligotropha]|nr:hypothetical protein [Nitrosomonas oligotropha]